MGCGPTLIPSEDAGADGTAEAGSTEAAPLATSGASITSTTSTTSTPPSTTSVDGTDDGDATDEGEAFVMMPDAPSMESCPCDVLAQDCAEGHKCMPTEGIDGDAWDCTRCAPLSGGLVGNGEPCMVQGSPFSGFDDCDAGLVCWNVDPDTLQGTCVAMCTGDEADLHCEAPTDCLYSNDGVLALCLPTCDPLTAEACPVGHACVPSFASFVCAPASGSAEAGEGCDLDLVPYGCATGLVCAPAVTQGASCVEGMAGCCTPTCAVSQGDACMARGQECVSWWGGDPAPAGLEDLGFCALP